MVKKVQTGHQHFCFQLLESSTRQQHRSNLVPPPIDKERDDYEMGHFELQNANGIAETQESIFVYSG